MYFTWLAQKFSTWTHEPQTTLSQVVLESPNNHESRCEFDSKQVLEMGFEKKYYSDGLPLEALDTWQPLKANTETPLALEHLELMFYFLCIGLALAALTFVGELLLKRMM